VKKIILFLLLTIISGNISYAQLTPASVEGINPKKNITFLNPVSNKTVTVTVGLCYGKIYNPYSGPDVCFYSYDITAAPDSCMPNFNYIDDSTTVALPKVCYIVHTYYPAATGPGQLGNLSNETAAIQAAIWHYTNNLNVNTITSTAVRNRANAIINYVNSNASFCAPTVTFEIVPDSDPDYFLIRTTDDNGAGVAVSNISLTITDGTLSQNTVNTTAPGGYSVPVQVIGGSGNGTITAHSDNIVIPKATLFRHIYGVCPKVILACPNPGEKKIYSDWGALPVELISFTSSISGKNVTLNWSTSSELNNSHFEVERLSNNASNWVNIGVVNGNGTSNNVNHYSFSDNNLSTGKYNYRLKQTDFNGNFEYFILSNEVEIGTPVQYDLNQNYPNPFNPTTKINFSIPEDGVVSLKVYDNSGKEVAVILNEFKSAGYYSAEFRPVNLSSGIYYYKMEAGNFVKVLKMILVK